MKQPELVSTPPERALEPPNNIEAWLQRGLEGSRRMATDEEYRKEIAKRLS